MSGPRWNSSPRFLAALALGACAVLALLSYVVIPYFTKERYMSAVGGVATTTPAEPPRIKHIATPKQVKALYMSSWVAGTPSLRDRLVKIVDDTEANALVIDVKDYTGKIAFKVNDPTLAAFGNDEERIPDIDDFIQTLHDKGIYVIARIATFQDPYMVKKRPDLAVKRASDGGVWRDRKNQTWLDPGAVEVWDYMLSIAKESYDRGFDEANYDYIRFPSDGNMRDIAYPYSKGREKHLVIRDFYKYVGEGLRDFGMTSSADLFGMTTSNTDDLNIGQILEDGLAYFDYVAPMVYPSHYPPTWKGLAKPATQPYLTIKYSMEDGIRRAEAASTSPKKLRPWLQDFDLGAEYTAEMVRAQIQATYDVGLDSWMLWDAGNHYTPAALHKATTTISSNL